MGLFNSSKKTYVASTVYNLAGDLASQPNYLRTTLAAAVLSDNRDIYIGESIVSSHLRGPGINQRRAFSWSKNNYVDGTPTAVITSTDSIDETALLGMLPVGDEEKAVVQNAFFDEGEFVYFAEERVLANRPDQFNTDWVTDLNEATGEITIEYEDGVSDTFVSSFDYKKDYIIAYYYIVADSYTGPQTPLTGTDATTNRNDIDTSEYNLVFDNPTNLLTPNLNTTITVVTEFSDGSPSTSTTDTTAETGSYQEREELWIREVFLGGGDGSNQNQEYITETKTETLTISVTCLVETVTDVDVVVNDVGNGETETVTTTTERDILVTYYSSTRFSEVVREGEILGDLHIYIYEVGSGNVALDNLKDNNTAAIGGAEFYPIIPLRLDNKSISDPIYAGADYEQAEAAYKRMTRSKLEDLLESIEDNPDIGDIDFAFFQYGVPLNTPSPEGKQYLYRFLKRLEDLQPNNSRARYNDFQNRNTAFETQVDNFNQWVVAQQIPGHALYGTPRPTVSGFGNDPNRNSLHLTVPGAIMNNYYLNISWAAIDSTLYSGKIFPGAKKGAVELTSNASAAWPTYGRNKYLDKILDNEVADLTIRYQLDNDTYEELFVSGLMHKNFVYNGKSVDISVGAALADTDDSGFFFPLHNPTVKDMNLIDSTQLTFYNSYIIFNSYQIVKKKWYQKGIFKVFSFVVLIIVAVAIPGIGTAFSGFLSGGLGAGFAGALGLSGLLFSVVAGITNYIVSIIVNNIITGIATALFGEKFGAILGAIAQAFVMSGGMSFDLNWSSLTKADNLLNLTNATSKAVTGVIAANTQNYVKDMHELQLAYTEHSDKIAELRAELNTGTALDPFWFLDHSLNNQSEFFHEPPDSFLTRTLMTGSDIVEASHNIINNFGDVSLNLPTST